MTSAAMDIFKNAQGGAAIPNLARQFGLTQAQAQSAVAVMLPQLASGIERTMLDRNGLADILGQITSGRHDRYADDHAALSEPKALSNGNDILGQLLGSKTGSRQVAAYGAQETGIPAVILQKMLPYLASILMGVFAKQGKGALGDILSKLPQAGGAGGGDLGGLGEILKKLPQMGGQAGAAGQGNGGGRTGGGGGFGIPGLPGGGGSRSGGGGFSIPGLPGGDDGAGQMPSQQPQVGGNSGGRTAPLPMPGPMPRQAPCDSGSPPANNPYGDIGDIIRSGGAGSDVLVNIVRSVLGGVLGRQTGPGGGAATGGGMISWLIKLLVVRYGWRMVTSIFRGILRR